MYVAYFVNTTTGQLMRTGSPKDNPKGNEWKQVGWDEFVLLAKVATFGFTGYYNFNKG